MKATGLMISSMGKEKNNGQTELNTKVIIEMVKRRVTASSYGPTPHHIKEISKIMTFKALESIDGQIKESSTASGLLTRCTDLVFLLGLMVGNMKANTTTIRNMGTEYSPGQTEEYTMDTGQTVNKKDTANIITPRVK